MLMVKFYLRLFVGLVAAVGALGMARAQQGKKEDVKAIPGPGSTYSLNPVTTVPNTAALPYGLPLMARFDLLPMLRDTRCFQDSSYDPSGGNGDADHYFKKEGNKAILADIKGPGCIYRFWSANAAGHLKIFFDGEDAPRIDCPMQDLFVGKVAPFVEPIVGHRSGGWYCFFPMPFQKSCRIEVTDPGGLYYHVQYQRFPDATPIRTFTRELTSEDKDALQVVLAQWRSLGQNPYTAQLTNYQDVKAKTRTASGITRLEAGQSKTFATLSGAGEVTGLHLAVVPADRQSLRQTLLRVYWDGAAKPAIESPVGDFFGVGFGDKRMVSLPTAMRDSGYSCYWPMPFARSARFELVNTGKTDLSLVSYRIESQKLDKPLANAGYFHAQWHRQTTVAGEYFHILDVKGRGHYVGEHTDMQGDRGIGFLEGDEKVYVDGETFPSIYGTGTEDFYTGGWYFDQGPFNLAYHGATIKEDNISRVSAYRFQIQDCVPFRHDFKIDIEHGGTNDYPGAVYSCVAYWYQEGAMHDWSPIDVKQLTPTPIMAENAQEAENLTWTGGSVHTMSDETLPLEASGGKVAVVSGDHPTAVFSAKNDDNYTVRLAALNLPGAARTVNISVDGNTAKTLALPAMPPGSGGSRAELSTFVRLKPGTHQLTLDMPDGGRAYVDYLRLDPSHKEAGVVEGESLLEKLTGHEKTDTSLIDAHAEYSGGGALRWLPVMPKEILVLPVQVTQEADYTVELAVDAADTTSAWVLQGDDMPPQTAALPPDAKGIQKLRFTTLLHMKPGQHNLVLTGTGPKPTLTLDYLRLVKQRYRNAVEAEGLKVVESKDGNTDTQDMKGFGPNWSGDTQLWFHGQKPGAQVTLELPVATDGKVNFVVYLTTAKDYGIVQTLVDGKEIGSPIDCYSTEVKAKGRAELGALDLTAGTHKVTFRVTGKNAAGSGYLVGVDAIGMEK